MVGEAQVAVGTSGGLSATWLWDHTPTREVTYPPKKGLWEAFQEPQNSGTKSLQILTFIEDTNVYPTHHTMQYCPQQPNLIVIF